MTFFQLLTEYGPSILSILGLSGCGILFYRQESANKELVNVSTAIGNSAAQNEAWMKIVEERNNEIERLHSENEKKDRKIDELHREKSVLRDRLEVSLEKDAEAAYYRGLYHTTRCDKLECAERCPPLTEKFNKNRIDNKRHGYERAEDNNCSDCDTCDADSGIV